MTDPALERAATEYEATRLRFAELASGMSAATEQQMVPTCPEWTVRDLVSHNVGLATDLSQGRGPTGDTQRWVDDMVADRRDRSVADQLAEWEETGPAFADAIRSSGRLAGLLLDIVAHEHDLAHAISKQGDHDSTAIEAVMDGPESFLLDRDLATAGLGAVRLVDTAGGREWTCGQGEVGFTLRASMFELFRLTGSRRSLAQLRASDHDGDLDAYLPGLLHMPAPEIDIVE